MYEHPVQVRPQKTHRSMDQERNEDVRFSGAEIHVLGDLQSSHSNQWGENQIKENSRRSKTLKDRDDGIQYPEGKQRGAN